MDFCQNLFLKSNQDRNKTNEFAQSSEDSNLLKLSQIYLKNKSSVEGNGQMNSSQQPDEMKIKNFKDLLTSNRLPYLPQIKSPLIQNKKSLFTQLMSNSFIQKNPNLETKNDQNSLDILPLTKCYTEDFQADSFIHTNSFYSHLEGEEEGKQENITKIDGVDSIQIQQENIIDSNTYLDTKQQEQSSQFGDIKKRLDLFHKRIKLEKEQNSIQKHQKLLIEMENIQEQERQKKQSINESAVQAINKMDGYRQLKQKLESMQIAIKAKSEKGTVSKETKKEIMNRFFSFVKNMDLAKIQNQKSDRYKFADFRIYEKAIEQKAQSIKAQHQKKKSSFSQKTNSTTQNPS